MKILLVEDFSNYHVFLREGLLENGCDVDLYSQGDQQKKTQASIPRSQKISFFDIKDFLKTRKLFKSYDIVQFIGVPALRNNILLWIWIFFFGKKFKSKFFFCAVGCDYVFWTKGRVRLKIPVFDECQKYDHAYYSRRTSLKARICAYIMLKRCAGVITLNEYYEAYKNEPIKCHIIPQPIDLKCHHFIRRDFTKKLIFFHGTHAQREGFKGSPHIKEAFEFISKKYPNDVTCISQGGMSYDEYSVLMNNVDVFFDQTNFVTYGMAALAGMAVGKVVATCSQDLFWLNQWLPAMGITDCPSILPILPDKNQLIAQVEWILSNRHLLPEMALKGREYVEKYHDAKKIALRFLQAWGIK